MYLMKEVNEIKVKMGKVETLVIEHGKSLENERRRFTEITDLLMELKSDIGVVQGRSEKGDVNVNFDSQTNVDGANNVNNETNIS